MKKIASIVILIMILASFVYGSSKKQYVIKVLATAYCPCKKCCGKWADGKTSTNRNAYLPGVAVDPKWIPLGAKLSIPEYNKGEWVIADDIGGAIKKKKNKPHRIDVRFKTHQEALEWGRKIITIRWTE
jgi:3D (Asp-Asp-Asp) domain-containing protein